MCAPYVLAELPCNGTSVHERAFVWGNDRGRCSIVDVPPSNLLHNILVQPSDPRAPWECPPTPTRISWLDGGRHDSPQSIDGWSSKQHIIGSVGIYHQITNLDGFARLPLAKGVVELDVALGAYPLTRESNDLIIVRLHLLLRNPHLLKCFPVEDLHWTPLIPPMFSWWISYQYQPL